MEKSIFGILLLFIQLNEMTTFNQLAYTGNIYYNFQRKS